HVTPVGKKLWIGTPEGLFIWDCQTNSLQTNALGNAVYCITPVDDTFWIGTHGEGVWILDGNGAVRQKITNEDGLADDIVYSILTKADHVAVATHNGLSMIDKQTKQIANYSRLDRLPANEFNQAAAFQQGNTF